MKVVLPVHHFPPDYSSGAELYTLRLARWLIEHGHEAEVVCIRAIDRGRPDQLEAVRDVYEGVPVWRLSFDLMHAPQREVWTYDNPLLGEWFDQYLQHHRPDVVHFQAGYLLGIAPLRMAHQHKLPTMLTLHDYWFICPRHNLLRSDGTLCDPIPADPMGCAWCRFAERDGVRKINLYSGGLLEYIMRSVGLERQRELYADRRRRLAAAIRWADVVISLSKFLARRVRDTLGEGAWEIKVSRCGLDLSRFAHLKRNSSPKVRIGYIGQIAPHKGVHLLCEAFRRLRNEDVELHIYGNLGAFPDYADRLRQLGEGDSRIRFHGFCSSKEVPQVLANFDVSVVPSVWFENSPAVILESLAAGTPVITSNIGGMAELVQDGIDGLHFAAGSADSLAHQLQRLLDEPDLLARLQRGAAASPTPRSIDDEMNELLAIYERAIRSRATCHVA